MSVADRPSGGPGHDSGDTAALKREAAALKRDRETPVMSDPGQVRIRPVTVADAPGIHRLSTDLGYDYAADQVAGRIERILNCTQDIVFVAELDGQLVGYAHASPYELLFRDPQLNLMALVVRDGLRGRGIGSRLLAAVEVWGQTHDYSGIRLVSASERTEAHRFYLSHGYTYMRDQKNFAKRWD